MKSWKISYLHKVGDTESIDCVIYMDADAPSSERAAQVVRDALFSNGYLIPDTPRDVDEVTVWQLQRLGVTVKSVIEVFRFHAQAHTERNILAYECHLFSENSGNALQSVKVHLRTNDIFEHPNDLNVSVMSVRSDVHSDLPLL